MSTSMAEFKKRLNKFLASDENEEEFRNWFACALAEAHKSDDLDFPKLAHFVQLVFAEADDGQLSEQELFDMLSVLASEKPTKAGSNVFVVDSEVIIDLSTATPLNEISASGTLIPTFYSRPEPASFRGDDVIWGKAFAAQQ